MSLTGFVIFFVEGILDQYVGRYNASTSESKKSEVVHEIVSIINEHGRFLRLMGDTWQPVPNCTAYKKVWHALYDKTKKRRASF
jgi:hypothetical protein